MAVVKGIREKVHLPLYDSVAFSEKDETKPNQNNIAWQISQTGNVIKFFVNVQNKTKLETNQQESSVLSHYNTYETRALRVVLEPPVKVCHCMRGVVSSRPAESGSWGAGPAVLCTG